MRRSVYHCTRLSHQFCADGIPRAYFQFIRRAPFSSQGAGAGADPSQFVRCKEVNGRFVSPFETKKNNLGAVWGELMLKVSNKLKRLQISDSVRKSFHLAQEPLQDLRIWDAETPRVTWLGHSSCLVQMEGVSIMTDPIWSSRAFPVQFLGPKRHFDPLVEVR